MRIALFEDDPFQSEIIVQILSQSSHDVVAYTGGSALLCMLNRSPYDMLILDWHTPGMLGVDVLSVVHSRHKDVLPVLFVTAEEDEKSPVCTSTRDAGDYIAKPFRITGLRVRAGALLRRAYPISYGRLPFAAEPHRFNPRCQQVTLYGEPVALTGTEFQLALLLFSNAGRTLSRDHIFGQVWDHNLSGYTRTIDSYISCIHTKLNVEPVSEVHLVTVYKHGYRVDHLRFADDMNALSDMDATFYST